MKRGFFLTIALIFVFIYLSGCAKGDTTPSAPTVNGISSWGFGIGDTLQIRGANFSAVSTENIVKLNGTPISVINATDSLLTIVIQSGFNSGSMTITVTVKSLTGSYSFNFTRLPVFTTIAGSVNKGFINASGKDARFNNPGGVVVDGFGNIFVCDINNRVIRKIAVDGTVSTYAGNGTAAVNDGTASLASFYAPSNITIDPAGNLYVTDAGPTSGFVRKVSTSGFVTTIAGGGSGIPSDDGIGSNARFKNLKGIAIDPSGSLFVSDSTCIRKITIAGLVTTIAGSNTLSGNVDATGANARFKSLFGLTCDASGNLFVVDQDNYSIRKITSGGTVTTYAGGAFGKGDGIGLLAKFSFPTGITSDPSGNIYVCENNGIRKINTSANVYTIISSQTPIYKDGNFNHGFLALPTYITIDATGNLYFPEFAGHYIRKIIF